MTYRDDSYTRAAALPTLESHNRGAPPLDGGQPAGVRCPACAAAGEPVEMRVGLVASEFMDTYVAVACPRCLLSGHRRCSPAECAEFLRAAVSESSADDEASADD